MTPEPGDESAVSAVVGEMLLIAIVLILVAVFSTSLADYLPTERTPTVTIMMSSNDMAGTITLWHKGGDWIRADSLRVVISDQNSGTSYRLNDPVHPFVMVPGGQTFDLGGNITVMRGEALHGNESVTLATDRAVIFSGIVGRDTP